MDLRQLNIFVAVVDLKSFSAAATSLHLSQSSVSAQIRRLEEALHVELIRRTTRRLILTQAGLTLYRYACDLLALSDKAERDVSGRKPHTLVIGASSAPAAHRVPALLTSYRAIAPDTIVEWRHGDSAAILEGVNGGQIDVGFVGSAGPSSLITHALGQDELVIATPNTAIYRAYDRSGLDTKRLLRAPILLRSGTSGTAQAAMRALADLDITRDDLNVVATIDSADSVLRAVSAGLGVAIVSLDVATLFAAKGALLTFPLGRLRTHRTLYLVHRDLRLAPATVRAFVTHALSACADDAP